MPSIASSLIAALVLVAGLGACGGGGPGDYDDASREAFLSACIEDDTDQDLVEVCECTYDTSVDELPFDRFQNVENRLQQGSEEVADDFSQIVLGCIREVSATRR